MLKSVKAINRKNNMKLFTLTIIAAVLLFASPVQAAGQAALINNLCLDSPAIYLELIELNKTKGWEAAAARFRTAMHDPDSDCMMVPKIPIIVLEELQRDDIRDGRNRPVCSVLYRVKMKGQSDPGDSFYTVNHTQGTCKKDNI